MMRVRVAGLRLGTLVIAGLSASCVAPKSNEAVYYDLSHEVPTFAPFQGALDRADLNRPFGNSRPAATSGGFQAVRRAKPDFPGRLGYFQWGIFVLDEHYSTHIDSQHHFVTTAPELQIDDPDRRTVAAFALDDLIGPIVYIDVSDRVQLELDKNGGQPSPDPEVTDFGESSMATVRVADLAAVEEFLVDGAFLVLNLGWAQFFWGASPANSWLHPYNNAMNHPGLTKAAVDWLLALEKRKGFHIKGFVADNIAVESGATILGPDGTVLAERPQLNGLYLHAVGLQRGWKIIENATNLEVLASHPQGSCTLIVGAPKIAGASGTPARLIAACPPNN
jgi:kynurenine formamidase